MSVCAYSSLNSRMVIVILQLLTIFLGVDGFEDTLPCSLLEKDDGICMPYLDCIEIHNYTKYNKDFSITKSDCPLFNRRFQFLICCKTSERRDHYSRIKRSTNKIDPRLIWDRNIGIPENKSILQEPIEKCLTPNNEEGSCIPLTECEVFINARKSRNITVLNFLRDSQCNKSTGYSNIKVCCGSVGYPVEPGKIEPQILGPSNSSSNTVLPISESPTVLLRFEDICTTPNNETGKCQYLKDCEIVKKHFYSSHPSERKFAKMSICQDGLTQIEKKVCCGTKGYQENDDVETKSSSHFMQCITPNGKNGLCKLLDSCEVIKEALREEKEGAREFAQKSKCNHHKSSEIYVCCGDDGVPNAKMKLLEKVLPSKCGKAVIQTRILGGDETKINEFPWMALLHYKNNTEDIGFLCGGALISSRYVLTAAHCLKRIDMNTFRLSHVRLGEYNLNTTKDCDDYYDTCADPIQDVYIEKIIRHKNYKRRSGKNDIGLIRLKREVKFTEYISPVCLPLMNYKPPKHGQLMTVSGWGRTEVEGAQSFIKLKVDVPCVNRRKCAEMLTTFHVNKNMTCAGGVEGRDSCDGDSGGPLMNYQNRRWYIDGIVAKGRSCGFKLPAVYTRVSKYNEWILENLES